MLKSQAGSAMVMGILVMIFLSIMAAGLLPWITNETKLATMSKDALEAQYAAEGGARRAILDLNQRSQTSGLPVKSTDWITTDLKTKNLMPFTDQDPVSNKNYYAYLADSNGNLVTKIDSTTQGTFILVSVGTVGKAVKTVKVGMRLTADQPASPGGSSSSDPTSPFYYTTYSGNVLDLHNTGAINGRDFTAANQVLGTNGGSGKKVDDPGVIFPDYATLTGYRDPSRPVSSPSFNGNKYTLDMNTNLSNTTLVIDGDLDVSQNVNFNNVTLYVNGKITFNGGGVNFNGTNFIVANGNLDAKSDINFGSSVVVSYGVLDVQSINLQGSIVAQGNEEFKGNTNITYNQSVVDSFIKPSATGTGQSATATATAGTWTSQ